MVIYIIPCFLSIHLSHHQSLRGLFDDNNTVIYKLIGEKHNKASKHFFLKSVNNYFKRELNYSLLIVPNTTYPILI